MNTVRVWKRESRGTPVGQIIHYPSKGRAIEASGETDGRRRLAIMRMR